MDITINQIINRKLLGDDCTEAESAEIKGYLKELKLPEEQKVVAIIQELFPQEYGEALDEMDDEAEHLFNKQHPELNP